MKKTLICIAFIISASSYTFAQKHRPRNFNSNFEAEGFEHYIECSPFPQFENEFYNFYSDSTFKRKVRETKLKSFKFEKQITRNRKVRKIVFNERSYLPSGKLVEFKNIKSKPLKNKIIPKDKLVLTYNKHEDIILCNSFKRWDKLRYRTVSNFDSTNLLSQNTYYRGNKIKYNGRTVYEWYEKGKPKLITYYGIKEFKPDVVSFDCLPEGKNENTRKDTTTICKNLKLDENGNRIEIDVTRNEKGKEMKTIRRYNKADKLVSLEYFNSKGKYESGEECSYNSKGKLLTDKSLKKDKKIKTCTTYTYDERGNKTSYTFSRHDKPIKAELYSYNDSCQEVKKVKMRRNIVKLTTTQKYDGKKLIEYEYIRKDGKRKRQYERSVYEYGENFHKESSFRKDSTYVSGSYYEFDSKKQLIKSIFYGKDRKQTNAIMTTYNDKGLFEKMDVYKRENKLKTSSSFKFEYYK